MAFDGGEGRIGTLASGEVALANPLVKHPRYLYIDTIKVQRARVTSGYVGGAVRVVIDTKDGVAFGAVESDGHSVLGYERINWENHGSTRRLIYHLDASSFVY